MAPLIHLVRHAQGYHNLSKANEQIHDPELTPFGEQQCAEFRKNFPIYDQITHLTASPIRRTLYTCLLCFAPLVEKGMKIIAVPDAQEVSGQPCDTGSDPDKLKEEFDGRVDLHLVQPGWNDKTMATKYYPAPDKLEARAKEVRLWLRDLVKSDGDNAQVVLVTHGGILHFITEDWDGSKAGSCGWANTEWRSYEFADLTFEDPNASLKETSPSWRRRRGSAIPLTETEQFQLREALKRDYAKELHEKDGYEYPAN